MATPPIITPPSAGNSIVRNLPGNQDVRPEIQKLRGESDPKIQAIYGALNKHQEHIDSIKRTVLDIVAWANRQTTANSLGIPTAIDIPNGPHITPFPGSIPRIIGEKAGEALSVMDFGAEGDAITVFDGATTSGSPNLASAAALFRTTDKGKTIIIVGAGPAGIALVTTILSVTDNGHVVMSANSSATLANAETTWGTNDSAAFQLAITNTVFSSIYRLTTAAIYVPPGRYIVSTLVAIDRASFRLYGAGPASVLLFITPATGNSAIDFTGCSSIQFDNFTSSGRYTTDAATFALFSDGSASNPAYGQFHVHHLNFLDWPRPVLGLSASASKTASDIRIEDNFFYNCGSGITNGSLIHAQGPGSRLRYRIHRNLAFYVTQPASNPQPAITIGGGTNEDIEASSNMIVDCPATGIVIKNRPIGAETTSFLNAAVNSNVIVRPRFSGIANYGVSQASLLGNLVYNPGIAASGADENRCGIYISDRKTGASTFTAADALSLQSNILLDDQGPHTMKYGILETISGSSPSGDNSGIILGNFISGFLTSDVSVLSKFAILRTSGTKFSQGKSTSTAAFNIDGDLRAESSTLFDELCLLATNSTGGFKLGYGWNLHFDGTNWVTGFDGTNNGAAAILLDYATGLLNFYCIPKTGGGSQVITPANLVFFLMMSLDPNLGKVSVFTLIEAATGRFVDVVGNPDLRVGGGVVNLDPTTDLQINNTPGLTINTAIYTVDATPSTQTITYKDGSGVNQTITVVTAVPVTLRAFIKGMLTA